MNVSMLLIRLKINKSYDYCKHFVDFLTANFFTIYNMLLKFFGMEIPN